VQRRVGQRKESLLSCVRHAACWMQVPLLVHMPAELTTAFIQAINSHRDPAQPCAPLTAIMIDRQRSSGATTVRDTAPATPPAINRSRPWLGGTWPRRYSMEATHEAESAQAEMMWVWLIWVSGQGGGVGGGRHSSKQVPVRAAAQRMCGETLRAPQRGAR
jgi:hypothetical protein